MIFRFETVQEFTIPPPPIYPTRATVVNEWAIYQRACVRFFFEVEIPNLQHSCWYLSLEEPLSCKKIAKADQVPWASKEGDRSSIVSN